MQALQQAYVVHDRTHLQDPAQFASIAARIRGIAASGESKVDADLLARLPALEMISVFGVGYDGVDVAAARARGVPVTNTPDVLTEEVADMGIALMLVSQALLNMMVAVGLFPVTGQPLPLISKGGTSTLINCAYIGMILSVSRYTAKLDE